MLQCQIWSRGTGSAGEWEALTQGTKGKQTILSLYTCFELIPFFALSVAGLNIDIDNINSQWGQSVAWLNFGANCVA
jgi:hypothetical protein